MATNNKQTVRYGVPVEITPCGEIASKRTRYRATPYRGSKYVVYPARPIPRGKILQPKANT